MEFRIEEEYLLSEQGKELMALQSSKGLHHEVLMDYVHAMGIELYESTPHLVLGRYVQDRPEQVIKVPANIYKIGTRAFADRRNIVTVNIPEGVEIIGESAFANCENLENINLPESITHIHTDAFRNCPKLKSIRLPAGLTTLGNGAFRDCISLESIVLPPNIRWVEPYLFNGCSSLREITFPAELRSIERSSVAGTPWMQERLARSPLVIEQDILLDGIGAGGDVVVPEGVRTIAPHAFYMSGILESVTLPESVTDIGKDAFFACSKLRCIRFPHTGNLDLSGEFIEDSSRMRIILRDYAETGNPCAAEYLRTAGIKKELLLLPEQDNEAGIRPLFQYPELFTPEIAEKLRQWAFAQVRSRQATQFCAEVLDFTHRHFPEQNDDSLL